MSGKILAFIDANVYLSFYHYTKDDIKHLAKIKGLISSGTLQLHTDSLLVDEVARNRERKIIDAIRSVEQALLAPQIPRMMHDLDTSAAFIKHCAESEGLRGALVGEAKLKAVSQEFSADSLIAEIFELSKRAEVSTEIFQKAMFRKRSGNPPGKGENWGDEIHWECLLASCPDGIDLHLVTKDKDFSSGLNPNKPNNFLVREWLSKKKSELHLHEEIGPFLKKLDSSIQLVTEKAKAPLISDLVNSKSFGSTHYAIASLIPYIDILNSKEVDEIATAATKNSQIGWILGDPDVKSFYSHLIKNYGDQMNTKAKMYIEETLAPPPTLATDEDIPF